MPLLWALAGVCLRGAARREAFSQGWSPLRRQTTPHRRVDQGRSGEDLAALTAWRSSGRRDLPALPIDGHAYDLVHGRRRLGLLRRAETQVREYPIDGDLVVEVGHDLELAPALAAREGVGLEDLGDQARPARGTTALLGWLLFSLPSPGSSPARSARTRLA